MGIELVSIAYGMYGKIYLCPGCGKRIYKDQLHDDKCDYCMDPNKEYEILIKKSGGIRSDKK